MTTYAEQTRTPGLNCPPEVEAGVAAIKARLRWPSMHWGVRAHEDACPHLVAAVLDAQPTVDEVPLTVAMATLAGWQREALLGQRLGASLDELRDLQDILRASVTAPPVETCGWCGKPATGFASICGVLHCHGDDDSRPTCYERQEAHMSAYGSFLLHMHAKAGGAE